MINDNTTIYPNSIVESNGKVYIKRNNCKFILTQEEIEAIYRIQQLQYRREDAKSQLFEYLGFNELAPIDNTKDVEQAGLENYLQSINRYEVALADDKNIAQEFLEKYNIALTDEYTKDDTTQSLDDSGLIDSIINEFSSHYEKGLDEIAMYQEAVSRALHKLNIIHAGKDA